MSSTGSGPTIAPDDQAAAWLTVRAALGDDACTRIPMAGQGSVVLETFPEQDIDRDALRAVLETSSRKEWTDVKFRQGDPRQWLYLWLACVPPNGLSRMPAGTPGSPFSTGAPWPPSTAPPSPALLSAKATIRQWNRDYGNRAPAPGFRMAPAAHRDHLNAADPRFIIGKPASRLAVDWPGRNRDEHRDRRPLPAGTAVIAPGCPLRANSTED